MNATGSAGFTPIRANVARGTVLGGCYRIIRPLAAGGCGEVYIAAHTRTNGRFAVKVLHRDLEIDSEAAVRFRHEAEVTATIRHPHVVQLFDFNVTEAGVPFLVMELLDGELLSQRLARVGSLDAKSACAIIDQIAHALSAAHQRGIVHRDLKPENVMLVSADGVTDFVKLLDFGISQASWRPEPSQPHLITGTPEYMAPEQALSDAARTGPRTDQWALAAIAYEVLTGLDPFQGETALAALDKVVNAQPIAPSDLCPALDAAVDAVILRGLSKDPADRYPDVVAFSAALREALERAGGGIDPRSSVDAAKDAAPDVPPPRKTVRLLRRLPWRRIGVRGAIALVVLGAVLFRVRSAPLLAAGSRTVASWTQAAIHFAAERVGKSR